MSDATFLTLQRDDPSPSGEQRPYAGPLGVGNAHRASWGAGGGAASPSRLPSRVSGMMDTRVTDSGTRAALGHRA